MICPTCGGQGWRAALGADPLPSGEPGEPYQVQEACPDCGGQGSLPDLSERARQYSNDDGDFWVPVEDRPDRAVAAQEYADETGLIVRFEGQHKITAQDCECVPPDKVVCPDLDGGGPCQTHEALDCWAFTTFEASEAGEADLLIDGPNPEVWRPEGRWAWAGPPEPGAPETIPVTPGQVEAGL